MRLEPTDPYLTNKQMKKKTTLLLAGLVAVAAAMPLSAAPMQRFDKDKSGDVSLAEFVKARVDGRLKKLKEEGKSDEELAKAAERNKQTATKAFKDADANGDGVLNQAELDVATAPKKGAPAKEKKEEKKEKKDKKQKSE